MPSDVYPSLSKKMKLLEQTLFPTPNAPSPRSIPPQKHDLLSTYHSILPNFTSSLTLALSLLPCNSGSIPSSP